MSTLLLFLTFLFPTVQSSNPAHSSGAAVFAVNEVESALLVVSDSVKDKNSKDKLYTKALLALTDSEKVGLRCSAFLALIKLDHPQVKEIFLKHLHDTDGLFLGVVWKLTADFEQVNQFMLEQLHPVHSKSSYRLTKQEYEKYRKLVYE